MLHLPAWPTSELGDLEQLRFQLIKPPQPPHLARAGRGALLPGGSSARCRAGPVARLAATRRGRPRDSTRPGTGAAGSGGV